ncbi:hypothetical protein HW555_001768 [Spodoptera exigua]|uniref:Uncharacterized protein n=1 Tax=Spodoptera exigua TaxID=7107 RepID=A0A835L8I5_SPOEX|nr:hypothetical protein HW555_001768 [Spodoptera exigua]
MASCITFAILIALKFAAVFSDDDEDKLPGDGTQEEEWHMDFMPTGYLPDSVYRELAWYGILQIQPLHHSSKYKVAAQLIWQHTLGRPHVIMENPPQSTQSPGKVSRQILAEEAAKWSREQRAVQEVFMENIKTGGNGITVRTVVSSTKKSVYIIQNGRYYQCPPNSEPDLDDYRKQPNLHDRRCTFGQNSEEVPLDPCIEAEVAPIEYSFNEGWMFCLGNGDRENNYFQNGTLDCGNKTKIAVSKFLDECAIDNNIVITFEYFGDEPRKDVLRNATLCTTWDPCRLSYLYRLEPPPVGLMPAFPTTTSNPCESTVCPECLEENADDLGVEIPLPRQWKRGLNHHSLRPLPRILRAAGRQRQRRGSGADIADPFSKLAGGSRVIKEKLMVALSPSPKTDTGMKNMQENKMIKIKIILSTVDDLISK